MARWLALVTVLMAAAVWAGCSPPAPPVRNDVVYGSPFQPNALNPITAPDIVSRNMIEMLFDGLVHADDRSDILGRLATNWQVSADGTEWTFFLRPGVRWHDGQELTADDVKFTYDTVINPNSRPTVAKGDYASLEGVKVVDPYTVRFSLLRPDAGFLSRLVLGIAPRHLLEGRDLATAPFNLHPVGTGPFIFDSWAAGESVVLKKNPNYFGNVPKIDRLIWKVVPDSNVLALQTLRGEVDGAPIFNPKDSDSLRDSSSVTLHETVEGNTQISLQLANPLFQDVRVRQALAYAVDVEALIDKIMMGAAIPATGDLLPNSWAYNPNVPQYRYNPVKARTLLSAAGWNPGPDGTLVRNGRRFEFSLMTDAGHKIREQVMLAVAQYWGDLGISVSTGAQERNSFIIQRVLKGNFDAVLLQSSVQLDPDLSRRFHTNSILNSQNFLNYSNPELDLWLDRGLATTDPNRRREAYSEVQRILATDLPQISLFYPKTQYAFKSSLLNVRPSPTNLFWNAEEWAWQE